MDVIITTDHNSSRHPPGHDYGAQNASGQPPQDPWAQPPASQDPYGQPSASDPYGQPPAGQDPFAQHPAGPASDPYGHGQQGWSAPSGSGPSASEPYGHPAGAGGPAPQGQAQSRLVVGLLGIFLGGFGVHRFLMGYTTIGIIQIAVTLVTCGIGAWWGVIEGIMVLAKSPTFERDAHGRPLTD